MIDADVALQAFDRPPPRRHNPNADDLDRLAASLDYLAIFGCVPGVDEASD